MRLSIRHTTRYHFAEPVVHGLQRLRLTPKETQGQRIVEWAMEYEGAIEELSYDDQNFNHATLIAVEQGAREGGGVLRSQLPHWLEAPSLRPYIAALRPAHPRHGGGGAWYVILRRGR